MSAVSGSAPIFVDGRRGRESEVWLKTFYTGRRHFSNEAFNKRQEKFFYSIDIFVRSADNG